MVERGGKELTIRATPELKEITTPFGKQRLGILGVQGSRDPADVKVQTLGFAASLAGGVSETWFIVDRTGAYIGGLFAGTESTDQLSGPIPHRAGLGPGGARRASWLSSTWRRFSPCPSA